MYTGKFLNLLLGTRNGSVGSVPGGAGSPVGGLQPLGVLTSACLISYFGALVERGADVV